MTVDNCQTGGVSNHSDSEVYMTKLKYKILGREVTLISLPKQPNNMEKFIKTQNQNDGLTVILFPSLSCDFAFFSYDKLLPEAEKSLISAIAIGSFIFNFRGLPLSEITLQEKDKKIEIFNTGMGKIEFMPNKCKLLYTNEAFEFFGVGIPVSVCCIFGVSTAVIYTENPESFDVSLLPALLLSLPHMPKYAVLKKKGEKLSAIPTVHPIDYFK